MAATPQYPAFVTVGQAAFNTANTNRDGTGTLATLYTTRAAGPATGGNGGMALWLSVRATATTTNGMVRVFRHNGTTAFLLMEIPVSAVTPSGTVAAWSLSSVPTLSALLDPLGRLPLNVALDPGYSIRISTNNAEAFVATLDVGEY